MSSCTLFPLDGPLATNVTPLVVEAGAGSPGSCLIVILALFVFSAGFVSGFLSDWPSLLTIALLA